MANTTSSVRAIAVVLVVALAATAGATAATRSNATASSANTLSSCGTIDTPGVYVLSEDIEDAPADGCFSVEANYVSIYGEGHTVAAENATGAAVEADGVDQVVVSGLVAPDWQTGVAFSDVDSGAVVGNEFRNASVVGVSLRDGTSIVRVDRNVVTGGGDGVRVALTDAGNVVEENEFTDLTGTAVDVGVLAEETSVVDNAVENVSGDAIRVSTSRSVTVAGNDVTDSAGAISVVDSAGVTVRDNDIRDVDTTAIRVDDGASASAAADGPTTGAVSGYYEALDLFALDSDGDTESQVVNNTVSGTHNRGIVVTETAGATVADNLVTDTKDGVYVHDSAGVNVTDNRVEESGDDGVALADTTNTTVARNHVTASDDNGIYVVGADNAVLNNTATENGDDGLDLQNATRATVRANAFVNNTDDGVFLRDTDNATVSANEIRANGDDGLDLHASSWNVVENNEICENDDRNVRERRGATNNQVAKNSC